MERSLEKEAKFPKSPLSGDEGGMVMMIVEMVVVVVMITAYILAG